jgi:hypothetical protein
MQKRNMKKLFYLTLLISSLLMIIGICSTASAVDPPWSATSTDLIAGKQYDVGDVYVWNNNTHFHVLFQTIDDWYLTETHLQISKNSTEIPQTKKGNPIPGQFEHKDSFDITEFQQEWYITIPIPDSMDWGEQINISAHAVVAEIFHDCENIRSTRQTRWFDPYAGSSGRWKRSQFVSSPHSSWPTIGSVKYIWRTADTPDGSWEYNNVPTYATDKWGWEFRRQFSLPFTAFNIDGWVKINADNSFEAWMNTILLGQDGTQHRDGPGAGEWANIQHYDVTTILQPGPNSLNIRALNYGDYDNPAGLTFKIHTCYNWINQQESAWGDGEQFNPHPKRNWGMYFYYVINSPPVPVIECYDYPEFIIPFCEEFCLTSEHSYDPDFPDDDIVLREWDFDYDGITFDVDYIGWDLCEDEFPDGNSYGFPAPGVYNVTLRVWDTMGAWDIQNITLNLTNNPPVASIFSDDGYTFQFCEDFCLNYFPEDAGEDCDSIISTEWDFDYDGVTFDNDYSCTPLCQGSFYDGDGDTYPDPGVYNVTLRVEDTQGETDMVNVTLTLLNNPPVANIHNEDPDNEYYICEPFCLSSFPIDAGEECDSVEYHEWDFDYDGVTFHVDYTGEGLCEGDFYGGPPTPGVYNVTLRVTDTEGLSNLTNITLTIINNDPVADIETFGETEFLFCQEFELDGYGSYDDDDFCGDYIDIFEWDLHYDGVGTFTPEITGIDYIDENDFPDVIPASGYPDVGTYNVALRVTDNYGATNITNVTITIYNNDPVAEIVSSESGPYNYAWCQWFELDGYALSHPPYSDDYCDEIVLCEWDLTYDGSTFNVEETGSFIDDYDFDGADSDSNADVGTYNVALRVTDKNDATNITNITVNIINNDPIADISASSSYSFCDTFTIWGDGSHDPEYDAFMCDGIDSYEWDLHYDGVGTFTPEITGWDSINQDDFPDDSPDNGWPDAGTYNVALRVTDYLGATNITNMTIELTNNDPTAVIYTSDSIFDICDGFFFDGDYNSDPGDPCDDFYTYDWDLSYDGTFDPDPSLAGDIVIDDGDFPGTGSYTIALRVTDLAGATDVDSLSITVVDDNCPP